MRSVSSASSAEAAQNFEAIRESVTVPGAEPVAVMQENIPQIVVMAFNDDQDQLRTTRFAGIIADLPEDDLAFFATLDERNT